MAGNSEYLTIGPSGMKSIGTGWDEKGHTAIIQIFLTHNIEITSIQFQYVENGSLVLSKRHGSAYIDGDNFDAVKLDFPNEYITQVSGYKSSEYGRVPVRSLTIGTNRGKYGPFGNFSPEKDRPFCFKLGDLRQFGGFHGTAQHN